MGYKIQVDIVDPDDGEIKVTHTFWSKPGQTTSDAEKTARMHYTHHLAACEYFQAAVENGDVVEEEFEIDDDELPVAEFDDDEADVICADCGKSLDKCTC